MPGRGIRGRSYPPRVRFPLTTGIQAVGVGEGTVRLLKDGPVQDTSGDG